jgi:hypothetical protein
MRAKAGLVATVSLGLATLLVTMAIAQPRGRGGVTAAPTRPRPTASAVDPYSAPTDAGAAPTATTTATAAPTATEVVPPPRPEVTGDGRTRLSPLNPAQNEFPDGGPPAQSVDYDKLLADIAALRARIAAVSDTLFHSRLAIALETSGDHGAIGRLAVSIDDGVVFTAAQGFRADDLKPIFEQAVAPGRHAVTVEVERRDDRNPVFRTTQRSRFTVEVPKEHKLTHDVKIWDESTMGGDFKEGDPSGRYELRIRAKANAKPTALTGK